MIYLCLYIVIVVMLLLLFKYNKKHWIDIETPSFVFLFCIIWPASFLIVLYYVIIDWLTK